ncbi:MAG: hypothetical protein OEZ13_04475 [Spirochaetia bacterium]|nr:hypothetical protein [Spirochaetia bacterium]
MASSIKTVGKKKSAFSVDDVKYPNYPRDKTMQVWYNECLDKSQEPKWQKAREDSLSSRLLKGLTIKKEDLF